MNLLKRLSQYRLRRCCVFLSPKLATSLLALSAMLLNGLVIVPEVLLLKDHDTYVTQFVTQQRLVDDVSAEEVERMITFSFTAWTLLVAINVAALLSATLMLAGVHGGRRRLLLPWLSLHLLAILTLIIVSLSLMLKLADESALVVLLLSAPIAATLVYLWLVVYSAFLSMRPTAKPTPKMNIATTTTTKILEDSFEDSSNVLESTHMLEASTRSTSIDTDSNIRSNTYPPPPYTIATKASFDDVKVDNATDMAAKLLEDKLDDDGNNDDNEDSGKVEKHLTVSSSSLSSQLIDLVST